MFCLAVAGNSCLPEVSPGSVQNKTPFSAIVPSQSNTAKKNLTPELTSTSDGLFQERILLEPSNDPVPPYLSFSQDNLPTSSGTYLLYKIDNELKYTSLDRTLQGTILSIEPPYQYKKNEIGTWDEIHFLINRDAQSPKIILSVFESGNLSLWVTDLQGNLLNSWSGRINPNSNVNCAAPQVSPLGNWMAGYCIQDQKSYPYIIDVKKGKGAYLFNIVCNDPRNEGWQGFNWYDNEESVRTFCGATQYDANIYTCYIASESLESKCSDVNKAEGLGSISENGEAVVVKDRTNDNELDEPTNTLRVVVEPFTCLKEEKECDNKNLIELPLYKWFKTHDTATILEIWWNQSDTQFAWELTPIIGTQGGRDYGLTTTGVIDLEKMVEGPTYWIVHGTIEGITPDKNWILYDMDNTLTLVSTENYNKRIVAVSTSTIGEAKFDDFMGWLVIP